MLAARSGFLSITDGQKTIDKVVATQAIALGKQCLEIARS
jgi:hypothetical protein